MTHPKETIEGYAITFNTLSKNMGGFYETIRPEAADKLIEYCDVLALLNHDKSRGILARSKGGEGSLSLRLDNTGLFYSFEVPDTALGREVIEGISRGEITHSSFSFLHDPETEEWERHKNGLWVRTITQMLTVTDVSLVHREAYPDTAVRLKSFTITNN